MANIYRLALSATALTACSAAWAQATDPPATLPAVTISSKSDPSLGIAGWGLVPLSQAPFQATLVSAEQMRNRGIERLADLTRVDPAVGDAYNAEGYWDFLSLRGYVIDNRYNYRRDGLPINAETSIPLDNKERIELLEGISGLQAGTSAPGGLVNYVVKRPLDQALRSMQLAWRERGTVLGTLDISQRFGPDHSLGMRVNASTEHIDPLIRDADGHRDLLAVAGDWRLGADSLLEAEFETSHRSQPSVPGFSLLGSKLPAPSDPRINLNNQPWSLPVVFDGSTASVRFSHALNGTWGWVAHAATQRLVSDDRIAFPYGCMAEGNPDRYCSDGSFDLYDYRSGNERRRTDAFELSLHGSAQTGAFSHALSAGVLRSQVRNRFQQLAYNLVGSGNIEGTLVTSADPSLTADNTNRDEHNTEAYVRDSISLGSASTAWVGLRHSRLSRSSVSTSGTDSSSYAQDFTTPWLAISHEFAPQQLVYASWGQGVESSVVPNLPAYGAAGGQALPALKSRQIEIGIKGHRSDTAWSVAWFDIDRPATSDTGSRFFTDGSERHRGIEGSAEAEFGAWNLGAGAMLLDARRRNSESAFLNGLRPTNVPQHTANLKARYRTAAVTGLDIGTSLMLEGKRMVLPDNSISIPGYTHADVSLRYERKLDAAMLTWRAGIDNVFDRRAWRESPNNFGHVYLFPPARAHRPRIGPIDVVIREPMPIQFAAIPR